MPDMNIQRNARVEAADGEVGRVTHVVVDPQTREVTDLAVGHDGHEWLVPMSAVASVEGDRVVLNGRRSTFQGGRTFDRDRYRAVDDEEARDESAGRAKRGGVPLLDADDAAVHIGAAPQPAPTPVPMHARQAGSAPSRSADRIQLREEELVARKREVEAGEVGIRKEVVIEQQEIEVPVTREEVVIERRPVEGRPTNEPIGAGETIRVPVHEERVTLDKQTVVREEIEVGTREVEETARVTDSVRREEARIETEGEVHQVHSQGATDHFASKDHRHGQRS